MEGVSMRKLVIISGGGAILLLVAVLVILFGSSLFDPLAKYDRTIQQNPRLSKIYEKDFYIGAAVEPYQLVGAEAALLRRQFNSLTAENAMKFTSIHPEEDVWDFSGADAIATFARRYNMKMRGHTFVWHHPATVAPWMFNNPDGSKKTRDQVLAMLEEHMRVVMTRYKDVVYAWDIVNEAIDQNEADGMRRTMWYDAIGPDYVEKAFEIAQSIDPDAILFYNDFMTFDLKKNQLIYDLVKNMKDKGIKVDGIGMQMHLTVSYPEIEAIKFAALRFKNLGVKIHVTEMDMSLYTQEFEVLTEAPEDYLIHQAYRYRELFDFFKEYKETITSVTLWGFHDGHTWLTKEPYNRGDWPLLFDAKFKGKLAFAGVTGGTLPEDVEIAGTKPPKVYVAHKGKPVIDGKIDAVWDKAEVISTDVQVMANSGATAKVRALWDDSHLYFLAEVTDPLLNGESDLIHEQDSFEAFVDENNDKTSTFGADDYQYRYSFNNKISYGGKAESKMMKGKAVTTGTGYIVELAVTLNTVTGASGKKVGLDFQINDANATAKRVGISKWNDPTNESWRNATGWGILEMAE